MWLGVPGQPGEVAPPLRVGDRRCGACGQKRPALLRDGDGVWLCRDCRFLARVTR